MKKFKIPLILTTLYLVFIGICLYGIYTNPNTTKCGVLINIVQHANVGKHTTTFENRFVVKYDDGVFDEVKPTLEDFYTLKKGDRVCYEQENHRGWNAILIACGLFFGILLVMFWIIEL